MDFDNNLLNLLCNNNKLTAAACSQAIHIDFSITAASEYAHTFFYIFSL